MKALMKLKDMPNDTDLSKVKVKAPNGTIGWWVSQWNKGVWLRENIGDTRIHPVFVEDLKECLEWDVLETS